MFLYVIKCDYYVAVSPKQCYKIATDLFLSFNKNRSVLLVRLKGFEPPTYWFVASHSIQLSYSRIPPAGAVPRRQLIYISTGGNKMQALFSRN